MPIQKNKKTKKRTISSQWRVESKQVGILRRAANGRSPSLRWPTG
ncbi:hypothetical protein CKA32_002160 [Geitlerinema sp. FC II]|nr:hypothetical protein CKA32_002160 [Geitlerinema sp. FC II]